MLIFVSSDIAITYLLAYCIVLILVFRLKSMLKDLSDDTNEEKNSKQYPWSPLHRARLVVMFAIRLIQLLGVGLLLIVMFFFHLVLDMRLALAIIFFFGVLSRLALGICWKRDQIWLSVLI